MSRTSDSSRMLVSQDPASARDRYIPSRSSSSPPMSSPRSISVSSSNSSSVPIGIKSSGCGGTAPAAAPAAAGALREASAGLLLPTGLGDRRTIAAARLLEPTAFRALVDRDAPDRLRAALLVFRAAVRLRLADTLRFRPAAVAPREVAARLRDAVRLLFFLPRGGIFLLRELGSHRSEPSKFAARSSFIRTRRSASPSL